MQELTSTPSTALAEAIILLRTNGFRVSKPKAKPQRKHRVGPTCVCTFSDGQVTRMSTYVTDLQHLDWKRGHALSIAAYESRARRKNRQWCGPLPAIVSAHFEMDGIVLARAGAGDNAHENPVVGVRAHR